jgi:hypothetical protein
VPVGKTSLPYWLGSGPVDSTSANTFGWEAGGRLNFSKSPIGLFLGGSYSRYQQQFSDPLSTISGQIGFETPAAGRLSLDASYTRNATLYYGGDLTTLAMPYRLPRNTGRWSALSVTPFVNIINDQSRNLTSFGAYLGLDIIELIAPTNKVTDPQPRPIFE